MQEDGRIRVELVGDKVRIVVICDDGQEAGFKLTLTNAEHFAERVILAVRLAEATFLPPTV